MHTTYIGLSIVMAVQAAIVLLHLVLLQRSRDKQRPDPAPLQVVADEAIADLPLMSQPALGTPVKLLVEDAFLADYCFAPKATIGTVVGYSQLDADDTGLLVDWGQGTRENPDDKSGSRVDLREISLVSNHV